MGYTGSARRGVAGKAPARAARKLGSVRRSQLVTTYGVGSLIAIDNESFIVSGLASWDVSDAPEIYEHRLARLLGVQSFRLPPAPDMDRAKDGVRVRRFPEFYSCPTCRVLQKFREFNTAGNRANCGECEEPLVPSRFVLACDAGHIEDFPYRKWIHRGKGADSGICQGSLKLQAAGASASLRSIVVECSCGERASMEGAFRRKALRDLGIRCSGRSPWLKDDKPVACDQPPRTMQRGSSSVWNPVVSSALSIPPFSEGVHALVEREKLADASDDVIRWFCRHNEAKLRQENANLEDVLRVTADLRATREREEDGVEVDVVSSASLRMQEYQSLLAGNRERLDDGLQSFVCEPPEGSCESLREMAVGGVMLVKRLREVRALAAFTRGTPPEEEGNEAREAPLGSADLKWLPAIEVVGEGVFLRLDEDRLREWENRRPVHDRVRLMRGNHLDVLRKRAALDPRKSGDEVSSPITPRRVLLHTLAHVLINEWSLDGGYPASALRERIYAGSEMSGILIYTATSDSAGSLGGVVAQGEPDRLSRTLDSALLRASWCSNDPLCMESTGSGADGVNLAACHACVLLPETSCENNNYFLDRGLLIGGSPQSGPGYFSQVIPEGAGPVKGAADLGFSSLAWVWAR